MVRRRMLAMLLALLSATVVTPGCSDAVGSETGQSDDRPDVGFTDAKRDTSERTDVDRPPRNYPVVLAHGFAGFDHLVDVESFAYYFRVKSALEEAGETVVIGEVDPFNDSTERGEQLIDIIESALADSRYEKVMIIGHSQGGLDARYVAHHRPDLVSSVVTISTPHRGTIVADVALDLVDNDLAQAVIDEIVQLFGKPLYDEAGNKTSLFDALEQFSESGVKTFNDSITNAEGVYYASVAGRTDGHLGKEQCDYDQAPPFIEKWRDTKDPVDPLLDLAEDIVDGTDDDPKPNDGLVTVSSAKWGEFLGCIPADHLDEVGQLLGDDPGGGNDWNHRQFYVDLVDFVQRKR